MIRIQVARSGFDKEFGGLLARAKNPTAMLLACGRELGNQLKSHFRKKDAAEPNKLSSRREHFWLQVSRTVSAPTQSGFNAISVSINDPRIAQKVFGGTITAKRAGALTIPVEEKAYGRTAATFERETGLKLFLLKSSKGNAVLATKLQGGGIEVEYLLAKSVTQKADPTALPDERDLEKAILARGQAVVDRENQEVKL